MLINFIYTCALGTFSNVTKKTQKVLTNETRCLNLIALDFNRDPAMAQNRLMLQSRKLREIKLNYFLLIKLMQTSCNIPGF